MRQTVQPNDIVYIKFLDKLGIVQKLADTQLNVLYRNDAGKLTRDWLLKDNLRFIVGANPLVKQPVPEAVLSGERTKPVVPRKEA